MTAINGPVLFNSATGSDTAASGLGPATALSGAGASTTAASAVVTGITTTGVTAGDLLWVQSSSGRQFSVVASVDSGTQVTCDDVFANTEASRTWAIGGKRATFENIDSRQLFNDLPAGGTIETESNQTMATTIVGSMAGTIGNNCVIKGSTGSEVLTSNHTSYLLDLSGGFITISNIEFRSAAGSSKAALRLLGSSYFLYKIACNTSGQSYQTFTEGGGTMSYTVFKDCAIGYMTSRGISLNATSHSTFENCIVHDCNGSQGGYSNRTAEWDNCIFARNNDTGSLGTTYTNYNSCIFWKNGTGAGTGAALIISAGASVTNCIFTENYNDAIFGGASTQYKNTSGNVFYNNVGSDYSVPLPQFRDDLTLTADPFTDAANLDFSINDVAGGGAVLRALSNDIAGTGIENLPFRQRVTDAFGGGGGGATHYDPFTNPRF